MRCCLYPAGGGGVIRYDVMEVCHICSRLERQFVVIHH